MVRVVAPWCKSYIVFNNNHVSDAFYSRSVRTRHLAAT